METPVFWVDAFTQRPFGGNPAAICPLDEWLPDSLMQQIAFEHGLSETAFFVQRESGEFDLRWFTPVTEVNLCGHATLASANVLFEELNHSQTEIVFHTRSGPLRVTKRQGRLEMNFP